MSFMRAVLFSVVLVWAASCHDTGTMLRRPGPPAVGSGSGVVGVDAGRAGEAGRGGSAGRPIEAGSAATVAGSPAGAGGIAVGVDGSMGVAGMYAVDFPTCPEARDTFASSGSRGGAGSGGAEGQASAADAARSTGPAATFSDIYLLLTCNGCVLCHGGAGGLSLGGGKSELYETLVAADGQGKATSAAADGGMCEGQRRIVPGNPEQSVLYAKVTGKQRCGSAMPPSAAGQMWTPAQLEQLRSWIAAGAKKN